MKFRKGALLLAALLLASCQSASPPPVASFPRMPGVSYGIDLPTDASDVLGELPGSRVDFVARYYRDPGSHWPPLSPAEAQRLSAAGVKIVTVWEWHSRDPADFTYAAGYYDALNAYREARAVGQPPGSAIYFAVDFNAQGAQLVQVEQYFRGVHAGLANAGQGRMYYRIGVYGSGAVCASLRAAGLTQYAWLAGATSWDGTRGFADWNIKQAPEGARFASLSFNHDANQATGDYGGFRVGAYAEAATPAGVAVTAAAQVPAAAATLVSGAMQAVVPHPVAAATPPAPPPSPTQAVATGTPPPAPSVAAATPSSAPPPAAAPTTLAALEAASLAAAMSPPGEAAEPHHAAEPPKTRGVASHASAGAHAAKASAAPKRRDYAGATNKRVAARAPHNPAGSSHREFHERGHRQSASRRSEDHGAHVQARGRRAVSLLDRPARRGVE